MLQDELQRLRQLADACPPAFEDVQAECLRVKQAWHAALFGEAGNQSLARYFRFHLTGFGHLSDTCQMADREEDELQNAFLEMIDHLWEQYAEFLTDGLNAPIAFHRRLLHRSALKRGQLAAMLEVLDPPLQNCLQDYLQEFSETEGSHLFSFAETGYFSHWLDAVYNVMITGQALQPVLLRLNFNHLGYFSFLQKQLLQEAGKQEDRRLFLRQKAIGFLAATPPAGRAYEPKWPPLSTMIGGWLKEEIALGEMAGNGRMPYQPQPLKLAVPFPVSYIALLTRLFSEESPGDTPLSHIFKFIAAHISSKRQPAISAGSFSKEYYSTDQHTAARVRDLLQKMIVRINRNFFPAWVAISVIIGALAGKC
jgi:hypothetical protein